MSLKTVLLLCGAFLAGCQAVYYNNSRADNWPNDLISPFPYPTYSPINIDTSRVRVANLTLLKHGIAKYESFTVRNTGRTLSVMANGPISCTSLSGGPLGNGLYSFAFMNFFWNNDFSDGCCSAIDDRDFPLLAAAYYWNVKYHSFKHALGYRDGLVITNTYVSVEGYIDNPKFAAFEPSVRKLTKAGSFTLTGSAPPFVWDNIIESVQYYYAYPGSYIDLDDNSTQYPCATIIQFPKSNTPFLSIKQFGAFQNLTGPTGSPINACLQSFPMDDRPVIEASCTVSGPLNTWIG